MQNSFVDSVYFYAFALFCNEADGLYISDGLRVIPTEPPPANRFENPDACRLLQTEFDMQGRGGYAIFAFCFLSKQPQNYPL
ncbi:hypothetical protein BWD08_06150 [Neisseria animaloris]|nr:hypothetical protein BWD08_06150 [Neisseria animaloris]